MANEPRNLKYTREHVWLEYIGDENVRAGITDYAQDSLGELVYVNF